jgi:ligand-binding sensor domain-containing protein
MWIGHYFKGISYVPLRLCNFEVSQSMRTDFNLQGNVFREFCSDNSGNIWIGTEDSGLNCFSPSTNTYINYSPMQPDGEYLL